MDESIKIKEEVEEEVTTTTNKTSTKPFHSVEESLSKSSTNDDVQRAIEGLKEIPDEELKEFLDDEDFMEGLDVVDAWEREEDKLRDIEQDSTRPTKQRENPLREHHAEPKGSNKRKKSKKEEKKREEIRRDPSKSSKDIERDKIRTKRDTESKLLAEKEKAIKYLLDSDKVVPPGTETEAIQSIAEEQRERAQREAQRIRERRRSKSVERYRRVSPVRRRSPDRLRQSPHRRKSPLSPERRRSPRYSSPARRKNSPRSYDRRSPNISPDRRRSPRRLSTERRSSVERRSSPDHRWSSERRRRRADWGYERRRSRSYERRSRSTDRSRRRSPSRSPSNRRYSPRRRSHSRSRSRSFEKRTRKRSPFFNELVRQLNRSKAMSTSGNVSGYGSSVTMEGVAPLYNPPTYQQETEPRPPLPGMTPPPQPPPPPPPPSSAPPYIHQSLPPLPPPSSSAMISPMPSGPFMNFEPMLSASLGPPSNYSSNPALYNQSNSVPIQAPPPPVICSPMLSMPTPSPQPVPPPMIDAHKSYPSSYPVPFVQQPVHQSTNISLNEPITPSTSSQSYTERGPAPSSSSYNESSSPRQERMLTPPAPPVISMPQQKTSLSSLLEASVSAKESSNIPVLYPGFIPEIMRNCEQALFNLPAEDPRLKMKGRFFYDRSEENDTKDILEDHTSNSILLQKSKTKIFWAECNAEQSVPVPKTATQMHQKICQTDEVMTDSKGVQIGPIMINCATQVKPEDIFEHVKVKEEKRPVMNRVNWGGTRDTFELKSKYREKDDLRWNVSNSQGRPYESEPKRFDTIDDSVKLRLNSPVTNRDEFSSHSDMRDHYSRETYTPEYHRRSMEHDDFLDRRSDHSRGESPMEIAESDEELMPGHAFQRGSEWQGKGKILKGKSHNLQGKHGERPHRTQASFRDKF
ncbi:hypothetical protein PUN28_008951 [Cardiocondyla obscurior]